MRKQWIIILLLFLPGLLGADILTTQKIEMIIDGQQAMFNSQWAKAYEIFEQYYENDNSDPAGYLFRAAIFQSEMTDREENLHGKRLLMLCDSTKFAAESYLEKCSLRDSAVCYLFIGHQYAYRSIWESRFGSSFSALTLGLKAKGQYQKALKADSTLYDSYLGLGSYHYWKTVKSGVLKYAGIFKNEKEKGIREIELAVKSSLFSKEASISALIWIMINEEKYDSAISLSNLMFQKYPEGNSFLWPAAKSYYKSKQYQKAAEIYNALLERLKSNLGNYYNIIEAVFYLKLSYKKLEMKKEAGEISSYLETVYSQIPKRIRQKQRSKLGQILGRNK